MAHVLLDHNDVADPHILPDRQQIAPRLDIERGRPLRHRYKIVVRVIKLRPFWDDAQIQNLGPMRNVQVNPPQHGIALEIVAVVHILVHGLDTQKIQKSFAAEIDRQTQTPNQARCYYASHVIPFAARIANHGNIGLK